MNKINKEQILISRHYIMSNGKEDNNRDKYYAYLLNKFGIEIVNPKFLNKDVVQQLKKYLKINIPNSFYKNPQDLKYFSCEELYLEQLISYINIDLIEGNHNKNTNFNRIELFNKVLPKYENGKEIKIRKYNIILENEINKILNDIFDAYCNYSRPFSIEETNEFLYLYSLGFYHNQDIKCKDNIFYLLDKDINFAKLLDRKDVVKFSVLKFGNANFNKMNKNQKTTLKLIKNMIPLVKKTSLSKKQAKFFNKLCKECNLKIVDNNDNSPYKAAIKEIKNGNVISASKIFLDSGSLFARNFRFLLSRANNEEKNILINMLPNDNPILLYQILTTILNDNGKRIFTFKNNNLVKCHIETDYEEKYRKSKLDYETRELLSNIIKNKIDSYYLSLPKLGKIYISEKFKKIALPVNNSCSGRGLDVLPTGSRIKINGNYIRTFCYWKNVFDIDTSALFIKDDFNQNNDYVELSWRNYNTLPLGESALSSGDCRDKNGAEYQDFKIDELLELGYRYVIYTLNGYGGKLDEGEIVCGYQNKNNLNTSAWDPKNIEFKINVISNSCAYTGFAIDLKTKEIIVLNLNSSGNNQVVNKKQLLLIEKYLKENYLNYSMYDLIKCRGEITTKEEANIIFDDDYIPLDNQKNIKSYEMEKLVALINE